MKKVLSIIMLCVFSCIVLSSCNQVNISNNFAQDGNDASSSYQEQSPVQVDSEEKTVQTEKAQTERPTEKPTDPPAVDTKASLEDVHLIDSNHYNVKNGGFTDSFGNSSYDTVHYYMGLNKSHWLDDEPWSLHYLNKQYKKFSGTIVLPDKDEIEASFYVHIYADGKKVYSVNDVTKRGGAVDFTVNVSGCEQLEIRTGESSRAGYSDGFDLGIVNTVLE